MGTNWCNDIECMHEKYNTTLWILNKISEKDYDSLNKLLEFRAACIREELDELDAAILDKNPEEVVDALIDIIVFSIGTLDQFMIDANVAWNEVYASNMKKKVGIKKERPNPLGLPDLIKEEDWSPPNHSDNRGILPLIFGKNSISRIEQ